MHKDRKQRMLQGRGGGAAGKTGVQGMLERCGQARTQALSRPHHG
jgi:hypothetical protein